MCCFLQKIRYTKERQKFSTVKWKELTLVCTWQENTHILSQSGGTVFCQMPFCAHYQKAPGYSKACRKIMFWFHVQKRGFCCWLFNSLHFFCLLTFSAYSEDVKNL